MTLRWDARQISEDKVWRSLSFAVLIKARNKADFHSKGNVYCETPNVLRRFYPDLEGTPFQL